MQQKQSFTIDRRYMIVLELLVFNHKGFLFDIVGMTEKMCFEEPSVNVFFF